MVTENRELVRCLITLSGLHRYRIGKAAAEAGLYFGQPMMLEFIKNHDGCAQNELAEGLRITAPSAAISLKRLEKAGFVERKNDEADSRKKLLYITAAGEKAVTAFRSICDETDSLLFQGFSEKEKEELGTLLTRVIDNIADKNLSHEEIFGILHEQRLKEGKGEKDND